MADMKQQNSTIRFVSRAEAFAAAPCLAASVREWQEANYSLEGRLFAAGETVWLESTDAGPTRLDEETALSLNRRIIDETAELIDRPGNWPPMRSGRKARKRQAIIAEADCRSWRGLGGAMRTHLLALAAIDGAAEFIVLPLVRRSILCQPNPHPPVARATERLRQAGFDATEQLAAVGNVETMSDMIGPLFWIARCNAGAPMIFIGAPGGSWSAQLCKYGNLHFEGCGGSLAPVLTASGFILVEEGQCGERFSRRPAIAGRRLEI